MVLKRIREFWDSPLLDHPVQLVWLLARRFKFWIVLMVFGLFLQYVGKYSKFEVGVLVFLLAVVLVLDNVGRAIGDLDPLVVEKKRKKEELRKLMDPVELEGLNQEILKRFRGEGG